MTATITATTKPDRLKYRLKEYFVKLFGSEEAIRRAKRELATRPNGPTVSEHTQNEDINKRMTETTEIPDRRLIKYAHFFGCTVDELKADYSHHLSNQLKANP